MVNKKLMAFRADTQVIEAIHNYQKSPPYVTVSAVINQILLNVLTCSDDLTLHHIIDTYDAYSSGYTVHFVPRS